MSFLYHFRVLERDGARVLVRAWITNPDVLAWGAKAIPKNTRSVLNTPHFAALLLREQCGEDDALLTDYREHVRKNDRVVQRAIAAGRGGDLGDPHLTLWVHMVALRKIASLEVDNVASFPAPKHAWDVGKTPAAQAKHDAYWRPWSAWDGQADPPDSLPRFDLKIVLEDAAWMPSAWPAGVKGTTAFARG